MELKLGAGFSNADWQALQGAISERSLVEFDLGPNPRPHRLDATSIVLNAASFVLSLAALILELRTVRRTRAWTADKLRNKLTDTLYRHGVVEYEIEDIHGFESLDTPEGFCRIVVRDDSGGKRKVHVFGDGQSFLIDAMIS